MGLVVKHSKQSGLPADDADASHVRPSDWYADHVITGSGENVITNGRFRTNQRPYVSATSLASGEYCFDRWKATTAATTVTFTAAATGQAVTINSGGSLAQIIEQAELPAGDYVLSWVGTATGRVYNEGGSAPSYAASPVLVTLDGTTNVRVEFQASGATKTLDQVKLELGSVATSYSQPNVANELIACMRHFQLITGWIGNGDNGSAISLTYQYPVQMRASPTLAKYPGASLNYRDSNSDTNIAAATWGIANNGQTDRGLWTQLTVPSAGAARPYSARFGLNTGPVLTLSAEL